MTDLSAPCRSCFGTRKACSMNCGKSAGDTRTRAEFLRDCEDCTTCACDFNRLSSLGPAAVQAINELPAGYRIAIDFQRQAGVVSVYAPGVTSASAVRGRAVIDGDGYIGQDVRAAIDWALAHARLTDKRQLKQWRKF